MRKGMVIAIIAAILLMIGIIAGIYAYQNKEVQDSNIITNRELASREETNHQFVQENLVSTVSIEEKTSPNCKVIEKKYFKGCDHLVRTVSDMKEEYINYTKAQIQQKYKNWKIEEFTPNQITLYQEQDGFCGQHYLIKENNGVLAIYEIDQSGKQTLKEYTEIQTMYLPEEDLRRVTNGIEAIGNLELYKVLEDFE